jgi:NAD(P)H-dependent FMN reductase
MPRLLVVHHTPSPAVHAIVDAVLTGARDPAVRDAGVEVVSRPALTAGAVDVLEADGYLLGSPANLGYMSGALKHFFDQIYYPCLDATTGRPFSFFLHGNNDVDGARLAIEKIATGLQWRLAQEPVTVIGSPTNDDLTACTELGAALAAGLAIA